MKHTKGNWRIQGEMILAGPFNNSHCICVIDGLINNPKKRLSVAEKEDYANAQLIAAAPNMLETLILLKEHFLKMDNACDHRITEAIEKATL